MTTKTQGESPPKAEAAEARLQPFKVEFGDNYLRNHTIATFRLRVRGSWSITALHQRPIGGRDIGAAMSAMPAIPGQTLRVEPREMKAYVEDPLADDPSLLESINAVAQKARSIWKGAPFKAVPVTELILSSDLLKTLIMELYRKLEAGHIKVLEGKLPNREQVDKLPGRELYDPWNNGRKPTYTDEVGAWHQRLDEQQGL